MAKRQRWQPQRTEAERQSLIEELRRWRQLGSISGLQGPAIEQRRLESVLRLDWDQGWPEGESAPVDPCPVVDLP